MPMTLKPTITGFSLGIGFGVLEPNASTQQNVSACYLSH